LPHPVLYLSDYLERHRQAYVDHLLRVSQGGDWQGWIDFFLRGVEVQSRIAIQCCEELLELWSSYKARLVAKDIVAIIEKPEPSELTR
jgi:Fic family protein